MQATLTLNWHYIESFALLTGDKIYDVGFMGLFSKPGVYLWVEQGAHGSFSNYVV
ncbi:hypothetical protein [Alishewanella longhuensis]